MTQMADETEIEQDDALVEEGEENQEPQETPEERAAREEAEAEARKYGWRPKEEYDRDPQGWVDAGRFLELPSTTVKMLRDQKRELERRMEESDRARREEIARIEAVSKKALERQREQERTRFEAELAQIRQAKREAAENADLHRYDQLAQREAQLKPPAADEPREEPKKQPIPEEFVGKLKAYREENEWAKDPALWQEAVNSVSVALQSGMTLPPDEQLTYAESVMKRRYPHLFTAPAPAAQSRVDGGGLATGRRTRGADDLPADARRVGQDYVKEGIYKTLAEYAADYFGQEAGR